ncbi:MAG: hypothetical protein FWC16_11605 [Defluviitaleaceae bacterium]|nr:hypothetical protein [Defluviitaleaceae bacterium]MCL2275564.1 hypothetical protein [Defluviitaleaceae bacterium]
MNISPNERDKAIASILNVGLTRSVSTWGYLRDMYRHLGLRVIFWDAAPAMLLSVVVALAYILVIATQFSFFHLDEHLSAMLFLFSPALFISMTICTEAIERMNGLYEIKMASKYTIRQITAFRLLCFSLIGTVFAVFANALIYYVMATDVPAGFSFQMISVALCSLFLCSLLLTGILRRYPSGWYLGALIWAVLGTLPVFIFREAWSAFLLNIPPAVALGVAAVAYVLFLREIKITALTGLGAVPR